MWVLGGVVGGGWDYFGLSVGGEADLPLVVVDEGVVAAAEQGGVVVVGGAAVCPVVDVVVFGPLSWGGAAGEDAADVSGEDGPAAGGVEGAAGSAHVEGFVVAAQDRGDDPGVAGEHADVVDGQVVAVAKGAAARAVA